jgi:hypothetical protein
LLTDFKPNLLFTAKSKRKYLLDPIFAVKQNFLLQKNLTNSVSKGKKVCMTNYQTLPP